MPETLFSAALNWPVLLATLVAGLLFASAVGLWAYYGTTAFFEMVRTGWMACF
jgi:hypothetical protein